MKKIVLILGHPASDSFNRALLDAYKRGALSQGAEVRELHLGEMSFDPNLAFGYRGSQPLEPDLVQAQELIRWAEHLVFFYPSWWGTMPALLKGFIDRVFLPGFGFKYRKGSSLWDKLLAGRTARLVVTMDAPVWYYYLVQGRPGHKAMKQAILEFCGIKPVRVTNIAEVRKSSDALRSKWLSQAENLGKRMI
ncbi:MAG: NAD(P)H-dependent oxidoreductase [Clostridia bacterium]